MTTFARSCLAGLAASLLLSACATNSPMTEAPALDGTRWTLASLAGKAPLADSSVTLAFEEGRAVGSDGCNRYIAPYESSGSSLKIAGNAATTMMACPPAVMAQAEAFLGALRATQSYRVEAGQLQLLQADGAVLATLAPQSQALAGGTWRVTGYNNGKQAVVGVLADTNITMTFATDGRVSGSAGCNNYTGNFTQDADKLSFGATAATRKMCARPEGIMEQEQLFLKSLETVSTARVEGDSLELRTASGALAVRATRRPGA